MAETQWMFEARARLADRGIDPDLVIAGDGAAPTSVVDLYAALGTIAASEKAGQSPTHAAARLALRAGLPAELSDTLFVAYNQQSAEEAGHGDKVFGNAYFLMGGSAVAVEQSALGDGNSGFLAPGDDPRENKKRLGGFAGVLGGIETVALHVTFPWLVTLCEAWDHPVARDLLLQIKETVRPEESRHVLIWRYVFHRLIAPKGEAVIDAYVQATNTGRMQLGGPPLDRPSFARLLGTSAPTARQLFGKDRALA